MKKLHEKGTAVYLISGGFKRIIERAAEELNIPSENVFANRLLFDDEGTAYTRVQCRSLEFIQWPCPNLS